MSRAAPKPLGPLVRIRTGKLDANANDPNGQYPFFTCSKAPLQISSYSFDCEIVLVAGNGDLNVKYYEGKFDAYQRTYIIESLDSKILSPKYLYRFLSEYVDELRRGSVGGVIKFIKLGHLTEALIPVPPLAEQEQIVKLLDEADELLKLRTQADRRAANLIPALFHEMFGDPDTNPKKLPIFQLGDLLSFRTGKLDSNAAVKDGAYPFFTCSREDSKIDTYAFDCEALLLAGNNAAGEYSVKHYKGKFNAYQRTYVLNLLADDLSYGFMQHALQLRLQELKRLSLGSNTKFLTLGIIKNIKIPLPNAALQKEFAQRVSEIRELEAAQAASRQRTEHLFQSMLHRAFNQEL